jgi:putative DNA primase/helicase
MQPAKGNRARGDMPAHLSNHAPDPTVEDLLDTKGDQGSFATTTGNLQTILHEDPLLNTIIQRNARTGEVWWTGSRPYGCDGDAVRMFEDSDLPRLAVWIGRTYPQIRPSLDTLRKLVDEVADAKSFDPVQDTLLACEKEWEDDGRVPRLDVWLPVYFGADDTPYTSAIGAKWLISGVARTLAPGCQVDHVLVLEGPQGCGKSQCFRTLAMRPEWFTDQLGDLGSDNAKRQIQGPLIIEIAELDAFRGKAETAIKSFLTVPDDRWTEKYKAYAKTRPRRCIFGASTNERRYLKDPTGARRFWPVAVRELKNEALRTDVRLLWGEATHRYHSGELWYLAPEEQGLLRDVRQEQSDRAWESVWTAEVLAYAAEQEAKSKPITLTGVMGSLEIEVAHRGGATGRFKQREVSEILTRAGYKSIQDRAHGEKLRHWVRVDDEDQQDEDRIPF